MIGARDWPPAFTNTVLRIYFDMLTVSRRNGFEVWLGTRGAGKLCGVDRKTARRAMRVLEAAGLLTPAELRRHGEILGTYANGDPIPVHLQAHVRQLEALREAEVRARLEDYAARRRAGLAGRCRATWRTPCKSPAKAPGEASKSVACTDWPRSHLRTEMGPVCAPPTGSHLGPYLDLSDRKSISAGSFLLCRPGGADAPSAESAPAAPNRVAGPVQRVRRGTAAPDGARAGGAVTRGAKAPRGRTAAPAARGAAGAGRVAEARAWDDEPASGVRSRDESHGGIESNPDAEATLLRGFGVTRPAPPSESERETALRVLAVCRRELDPRADATSSFPRSHIAVVIARLREGITELALTDCVGGAAVSEHNRAPGQRSPTYIFADEDRIDALGRLAPRRAAPLVSDAGRGVSGSPVGVVAGPPPKDAARAVSGGHTSEAKCTKVVDESAGMDVEPAEALRRELDRLKARRLAGLIDWPEYSRREAEATARWRSALSRTG